MSDAPVSELTTVRGWETPAEQKALQYLAERVPTDGHIAEIGSEFGMSTSILAMFSRPSVLVHAIDLFPDDMHTKHVAEMRRIGVLPKIRYYRGKSEHAINYWDSKDRIDLLFIDGDHTAAGVLKDIKAWTPLVRLGGVVVFHDTLAYTNKKPHEQHGWVQAAIEFWQGQSILATSPIWQDNQLPPNRPFAFCETVPVDSMRVFVRVIDEGGLNA